MCRLLAVRTKAPFDIAAMLMPFAALSKNSKEFQGHGWGCAYLKNNTWEYYKNIKPIWEDDLNNFGTTTFLVSHARSAFQDKGITIENNMPFYDETYVYIFNGELQGVKIHEQGRIGAEKIFNFIKRFDKTETKTMLEKGIMLLKQRTRYVKALNMIWTDKKKIYVTNNYNERPAYFQMWYKKTSKKIIVCSEPFPGEHDWKKIQKNTVEVF